MYYISSIFSSHNGFPFLDPLLDPSFLSHFGSSFSQNQFAIILYIKYIFSWCFILFPRLPDRFNFAHRNSFFMSHVISLWLVRTCNLQVLTSHREMSFELKGNANLIRYSDLCYPQQKLVASPGY